MNKRVYRQLTAEERKAILLYASAHGRTWKDQLRYDWMNACQNLIPAAITHHMQTIRNDFGPTWLVEMRLKYLQADEARSIGPVDISTIKEYGLEQKLSNAVRCF